MSRVINVVLSGGSGTRLWPISRESKPKQFLKIFDGKSLFQETLKRNLPFVDGSVIVINEKQINIVKSQYSELNIKLDKKIIESVGRNTAPAVALACFAVHPDDVLFVTPSDHMMDADKLYQDSVSRAIQLAKEGYLVTFGLKPTRPETGFGYIESHGEEVKRFREKPDQKTAKVFLENGSFLWNSGMFCVKSSLFLDELKKYREDIYIACVKAYENSNGGEISIVDMSKIPSESVDYAVFEKSKKMKVVASDFFWTDLGSFDSLLDYHLKVGIDNVKELEGDSISNVFAYSKKQVVGLDIQDLLIIDTEDTIFVMKKGSSDKVKTLYNNIKLSNPNLLK